MTKIDFKFSLCHLSSAIIFH